MAEAAKNASTSTHEVGASAHVPTTWVHAVGASTTERLVFVVILVLLFAAAARTPLDSDMWWHLGAGEATLESGVSLRQDIFSFTRFGEKWINHSWLAQVGMALIYRSGGWMALAGAMALLATASMALVYLQIDGAALFKAFLLVLGSLVASPVWSPRPQLASFVLFALTAYLLHLYRRGGLDGLWLMPPLFILWSNLHGGYVLGLMLLALTVGGEMFNHIAWMEGGERLSWKRIGRLAMWGGVSGLVLVINPNGIDTWLIPFRTVGVEALTRFISEWASPDFHDLSQQPFLVLLFLLLAAVGLSGRRLAGSDLFTVIWFGGMALLARRNFAPFALVALPVIGRHLWQMLIECPLRGYVCPLRGYEWSERAKLPSIILRSNRELPQAVRKVINLSLVGLLGFLALVKLYVVTHPALMDTAVAATYPVKAVATLKAQGNSGNLMNEYRWGGYLIWNMPERRVFIDGRTDLFGDEIIGEWITTVQAGEGWQDILDQWQIHYVLIEPGRPLAKVLPAAGWKLIDSETHWILYGR